MTENADNSFLKKARALAASAFTTLVPTGTSTGNNSVYSNDPTYLKEAIQRLISERLKKARLDALMDEEEAAAAFGYKNKAQIALLESGERACPNWVLYRACAVYGVKADYLLGIIAESDLSPAAMERLSLRHSINAIAITMYDRMADEIFLYLHTLVPLQADKLKDVVKECLDTLAKIRKDNPSFDDDIKGGNKLLTGLIKAHDLANHLANESNRRRFYLEKQKHGLRQMNLFADLKNGVGGGDD